MVEVAEEDCSKRFCGAASLAIWVIRDAVVGAVAPAAAGVAAVSAVAVEVLAVVSVVVATLAAVVPEEVGKA